MQGREQPEELSEEENLEPADEDFVLIPLSSGEKLEPSQPTKMECVFENTHALLQKLFSFAGCNTVEEKEDAAKKLTLRRFLPDLAESSIALGYAGAVTPFFERGTSWMHYVFHPFSAASFDITSNISLRRVENCLPQISIYLALVRSLIFACFASITQHPLIHEGGHALAGLSLFNNSRPEITIRPAGEGLTFLRDSELSEWGKALGKNNSEILLSAGGSSASLLWNFFSLIAAQAIPNPEIKLYLRVCVAISLIQNAYYALSANWDCKPGHDFCELEKRGLSPWLAAALIIGSFLFLQVILTCVSYCCDKRKEHTQEQKPLVSAL